MSGLEPPSREERQPSPIPDSTLARNFSDQLDGLFNLGGELPDLTQSVEDKRQMITTQSRELEALEARIKMAETKLQQAGGQRAVSGNSESPKDVRLVFPDTNTASSGGNTAAATSIHQTATANGSETAQVTAQAQQLKTSNATGAQH